ncbi:MAG: DEAD/DEAH box helicase [Candidatus Omnitrophica bacterium]|nr:DEAD/DEAH box helicase [Candidatus Omnitrophota bacterium]
MPEPREIFAEDGPIALNRPGYELRPQQVRMAEAVEEAIETSRNLVVEAGTGVGKSLAYLVPFIYWSVLNDKRVVISTYTKALQNQLMVKDLPFLEQALDIPFRYSICMGSENYLCVRMARRNSQKKMFTSKSRAAQAEDILKWSGTTPTGLVTDMDFMPDPSVWKLFSRQPDACSGRKCPYGDECFYRRSRMRQAASRILITNHSLLFADMMSEARVLPEFHALVLDEAHTVEDVATGYFGKELSRSGVRYLHDEISAFVSENNREDGALKDRDDEVSLLKEMNRGLKKASGVFFAEAERAVGSEEGTFAYEPGVCLDGDMNPFLLGLAEVLGGLGRRFEDSEAGEAARGLSRRCLAMAEAGDFVLSREEESYVYWVEVRKRRRYTDYSFHAAPVDISGLMKESFFGQVAPVVLTSATLSSSGENGDFGFVEKRLGLDNPLELALDSPYDYENNVMLYLDRDMPDPARDPKGYILKVRDRITGIYDIMGGRMFALFTSYDMMNRVAGHMASERPDIEVLRQGDLPRYVLLDVFKRSKKSVLMGTTTFWQGVDVPGDSLECVIITKLPFSVPTDPINSARIKYYREKGMNAFMEYQLPQAVIMFRQGVGRLIRSGTDRGVIAVLDPRVRTRRYGAEFLKPLKECRKTFDLGEIGVFFRSKAAEEGTRAPGADS